MPQMSLFDSAYKVLFSITNSVGVRKIRSKTLYGNSPARVALLFRNTFPNTDFNTFKIISIKTL